MKVDRVAVASDWRARGFSCELWTDSPGARWEDFVHATDELVTVIDGDVEFEIEGRIVRPSPGEELLIPAGSVHSARNVGATVSHWLFGYARN